MICLRDQWLLKCKRGGGRESGGWGALPGILTVSLSLEKYMYILHDTCRCVSKFKWHNHFTAMGYANTWSNICIDHVNRWVIKRW